MTQKIVSLFLVTIFFNSVFANSKQLEAKKNKNSKIFSKQLFVKKDKNSKIFLALNTAETLFIEENTGDKQDTGKLNLGKKWRLSLFHTLSRGAAYPRSVSLYHSLGGSYRYSKNLSFSVSGAYGLPAKTLVAHWLSAEEAFVGDSSVYGLSDISLSASTPLTSIEDFLTFQKWGLNYGVSLPTSLKTFRSGKYFGLFASVSHQKTFKDIVFLFNHVVYAHLHKYRDNIAGVPNRLLSSSHSVSVQFKKDRLSLLGSGVLYSSAYLSDQNLKPDILETKLNFRGSQGASARASYLIWKQYNLSAYSSWQINIPVVSNILTGFSVLDKKFQSYSAGLQWSI